MIPNKEEYVTYEQAKTLKKLGFNEICEYCYVKLESCLFEDLGSFINSYLEDNKFACPMLDQVVNWMRNKHHLHIIVDYHIIPKQGWFRVLWYFRVSRIAGLYLGNDNKYYDTYEEALSKSIYKCLEIINDKTE